MSFKIWVQYGDSRAVQVAFSGANVDELTKAIKTTLEPKLNNVDVDEITLRRHGDEADLEPDAAVDSSFKNTAKTPLAVFTRGK